MTGKNYGQHVEINTLLPKFHRFEGQDFLPSWQLRAKFFLLIQVILEKNQVQVLFLINKQGEAV